jgi:hypothetical protein
MPAEDRRTMRQERCVRRGEDGAIVVCRGGRRVFADELFRHAGTMPAEDRRTMRQKCGRFGRKASGRPRKSPTRRESSSYHRRDDPASRKRRHGCRRRRLSRAAWMPLPARRRWDDGWRTVSGWHAPGGYGPAVEPARRPAAYKTTGAAPASGPASGPAAGAK